MEKHTNSELLEVVRDVRAALRIVSDMSEGIAYDLSCVGLDKMAARVGSLRIGLNELGERLSDAYDQSIMDQIRHSEAVTGNLMLAVLSGALTPKAEA